MPVRDQSAKARVEKPNLERIALLKSVLQGFRARLDEELQPLGITTAQLRMLWTVEANPTASGAEIARLCFVTPQSGQATMARLQACGWVRRRPSAASERVLVAELTAQGRRVLQRARQIAESLDAALWAATPERELAVVDAVLARAAARLNGEKG